MSTPVETTGPPHSHYPHVLPNHMGSKGHGLNLSQANVGDRLGLDLIFFLILVHPSSCNKIPISLISSPAHAKHLYSSLNNVPSEALPSPSASGYMYFHFPTIVKENSLSENSQILIIFIKVYSQHIWV